MTAAMLDAIDSHVLRSSAVFGEIASAPFLPSSIKGASDFASVAPPSLCTATIASLASTVTALVRRVARLETTCVVLEGKWFGSAAGPIGSRSGHDALAFSEALTSAMRPLNDILMRHEAAIERIAQHLTSPPLPTDVLPLPTRSGIHNAAPSQSPQRSDPQAGAGTQSATSDADAIRRLEQAAMSLKQAPSQRGVPLAEKRNPTPHNPPLSSQRGSSITTTTPTTTSTLGTTTSGAEGVSSGPDRGSSLHTDEALRLLWARDPDSDNHRRPQGASHHHPGFYVDASAVLATGETSRAISADESTHAAITALTSTAYDVSGPSFMALRRPIPDISTAGSDANSCSGGHPYGHHSSYARGPVHHGGSGGIFDRVRGILSGDEGSDGSSIVH